jgi:bifunctional oligoribonuclease and PAP phosphatase NrnA
MQSASKTCSIRSKKMKSISVVAQTLSKARNVLITAHVNPDGDAVGSVLGLGLALKSLGKNVCMYFEDEIPEFLRFLPGVHQAVHHLNGVEEFDLAVVLDCGDIKRVGSKWRRISAMPAVINIDHHDSNTYFGHSHLVDPGFCATAEIIYRVFREMNYRFGWEEATNLYTGIMTDTASFCHGNIGRHSFEAAAELVAAGARPRDIAADVYGKFPMGRLDLLRRALGTVELFLGGRLGMITVSNRDMEDTASSCEDVRGFVEYVNAIPGVDVGVLLRESRKGVDVSLRSSGAFDVTRIARQYGGGGHKSAAGFSHPGAPDQVKTELISVLDHLMERRR